MCQSTIAHWSAELGLDRYHGLREGVGERPFTGPLLNVDEEGMYTCGACGAPLFASDSKFESHCSWPSFTRPEQQKNVRLLDDDSLGMHRIEVRCKRCDSHLGHVFDVGPGPEGTRYCINSLSLNFKPKATWLDVRRTYCIVSSPTIEQFLVQKLSRKDVLVDIHLSAHFS